MCEKKFISIKYIHPYSYANFKTFLAPPGITLPALYTCKVYAVTSG